MIETLKIDDGFAVAMAPPSAEALRSLADEGFRSIVNLRCEGEPQEPLSPVREGEEAAALGLEYRHVPVSGAAMSHERVDEFRSCVESLPRPILVHCASGKRAGAFTMMHIAAKNGMSGEATLRQAEDMGFACDEPALQAFVRSYVDGANG